MTSVKKVKTYHDGLNEMRSSILYKLRKDLRRAESASVIRYIATVITYVKGHSARTDARKGGAGKK